MTSEKGLCRVKIHAASGALVEVVAAPERFDDDTVNLDLAVDPAGRVLVLDPKRRQVRVFVRTDDEAGK